MPIVNVDCQIPQDTTQTLPLTTIDHMTTNNSRLFIHDRASTTNTSIYYSDDEGRTWTGINIGTQINTNFVINDNGYGFVIGGTATNMKLYLTQDNGLTYTPLTFTTFNVDSVSLNPKVSRINNVGYFVYLDTTNYNLHFMRISGTTITEQYVASSGTFYNIFDVVDYNGVETIYMRFASAPLL